MNGPMATCALRSSIPHFVQQMGYMRAISRPGARAWCGCPEARKKIGNCDPRHSPNGAGSSRVCLPDRSAPRIPSMSGPEGPGFETGALYFCGRGERMTVRLSCSQGRSADNAAQLFVKMLLPLWVALLAGVAQWKSTAVPQLRRWFDPCRPLQWPSGGMATRLDGAPSFNPGSIPGWASKTFARLPRKCKPADLI